MRQSWRSSRSGDFAKEGELAPAVVTGVGREFGKFDEGFGADAEEGSDAQARFDGGAGEEAVVADTGEAFGENVQKPAANELVKGEFEDAGALATGWGVVEAEFAIGSEADDAFGSQGAALGVAGEVS